MPILNQPFQGQLGNIIIAKLDSNYTQFTIFSAFAKNSGVLRLKPALEKFKSRGGTITAFIGIDLDGTSYEALLNLFSLCDSLYVIHSENFSTTYHSKIYLLENSTSAWCAVGSNNLTGGGLWTNFESAALQEYALPDQGADLATLYSLIEKYSAPDYICSAKITSPADILTLLEANYISREVEQKMIAIRGHISQKAKYKKNPLFGSEKVSIPSIVTVQKARRPFSQKNNRAISETDYVGDVSLAAPAFTNEQFWFEMRKSTGGSRNILDLSKLGVIVSGSVKGTPYEYTDPRRMYGGIKFFGIDPEDTSREKDITINYLGKDYYPSTIKFAPDNGSWRIQLKGEPADGTDGLSKFGNRGDFVNKILVFEKINLGYYVLSLLDGSELDKLKALSRVWGTNGSGAHSKAYGML